MRSLTGACWRINLDRPNAMSRNRPSQVLLAIYEYQARRGTIELGKLMLGDVENMKFYIASKLENYEQVKSLASLLKLSGWEHTYDWTAHGSIKETDIETLRSVGQKECDGVRDADVVIVLTPQGRGTHVELGIAIASNKVVYICHEDDKYFQCDDNTSAFYWLPKVNHFIGSIGDLAKKLQADTCRL